ncbi:MAG: hypothetical protein KYX69_19580 [Sphingomonas sp.]|uniref:hypothetical protein n=1 Tax=Sphingomonas sp. TaxID=28214 RepID=UPI00263386C6|nr:hypothetical protein [Sphingomonas sp.]MDK2769905.1 hypothetical protein [Sphingomonas sp.]
MDPDEADARKLKLLEIAAQDNLALATARNIAANGRLFCALIFAAHISAYLKIGGPLFAILAVVAAIPIGASCLIDQMPYGARRARLSSALYALATAAAFAFVFAVIMVG